MRQSHQNILFKAVEMNDDEETFYELPESKVKAKNIFFNSLWNSFMIIDNDENYYLMEFFNQNYFEKYWIRFKAIDENQPYQEMEDEFDKGQEDEQSVDILALVNNKL